MSEALSADRVVRGSDTAEELAAAALTLARRYAAGATMWCTAPNWPSHARHVAVEFVHPVIVGKRALPAIALVEGDMVGAARGLARPGDVLLAVGPPDDAEVIDLMRRAAAWGVTRIWIGAGSRPPRGSVEHTVWLEGEDPSRATRSGALVLQYHLLWELTHVVFEHPGLLEDPGDGLSGSAEACITCRGEAEVAEVRAVAPDGTLEVVMGGRPTTVDGTLVGPADEGDLLLVHAGVAIGPVPRAGTGGVP